MSPRRPPATVGFCLDDEPTVDCKDKLTVTVVASGSLDLRRGSVLT